MAAQWAAVKSATDDIRIISGNYFSHQIAIIEEQTLTGVNEARKLFEAKRRFTRV
jgi:hypothetical protein